MLEILGLLLSWKWVLEGETCYHCILKMKRNTNADNKQEFVQINNQIGLEVTNVDFCGLWFRLRRQNSGQVTEKGGTYRIVYFSLCILYKEKFWWGRWGTRFAALQRERPLIFFFQFYLFSTSKPTVFELLDSIFEMIPNPEFWS